jgi:hypothetical protein
MGEDPLQTFLNARTYFLKQVVQGECDDLPFGPAALLNARKRVVKEGAQIRGLARGVVHEFFPPLETAAAIKVEDVPIVSVDLVHGHFPPICGLVEPV